MVRVITAESFGELVQEALEACGQSPVLNMLLNINLSLPVIEDDFLKTYLADARKWQSAEVPEDLHFTHGHYMHRHSDSIEYLIAELKGKPTGNRACISLVDTRDIMQSKDGQLPSFLILQAGIDDSTLILTAYYRALEVSKFLPINLAEMALVAEKIWPSIPALKALDLTIHAFRAHSSPNFRTHTRSKLDMAAPSGIEEAVRAGDRKTIVSWLVDKSRPESIIETVGLATLTTEAVGAGWDDGIVEELNVAVGVETRLVHARQMGTHAAGVDILQKQLSASLDRIVKMLRKDDR